MEETMFVTTTLTRLIKQTKIATRKPCLSQLLTRLTKQTKIARAASYFGKQLVVK